MNHTQLKIEDYLHLYLGCECLCDIPKQHYPQRTIIDGDLISKDGKRYFTNVKPILRPLSDMTEEEKDKFCKHMGWIDSRGRFYLSSYTIANSAEGAKATLYLLKQGFDLFGLHEAGLCLYKNANNEYY